MNGPLKLTGVNRKYVRGLDHAKLGKKVPGKPKPPPPGGIIGKPPANPPWMDMYPPGTIQNLTMRRGR